MDRKHLHKAWAVLLVGATVLSGCGLFGSDTPDPPKSPSEPVITAPQETRGASQPDPTTTLPDEFFVDLDRRTPFSGPFFQPAFDNMARGFLSYDIYTVDPDEGPLSGGTRVHLTGVFPAIANADQIYTVYFGYNVAPYDALIPDVFTINDIYVVAPPGDAIGLVDVALVSVAASIYDIYDVYAFEPLGYEYLDPFVITDIIPSQGLLIGGTEVHVEGRFPVSAPIHDLATANALYEVTFGGATAPFRIDNVGVPIISAGSIYVTSPPSSATILGGLPGIVDVEVIDLIGATSRIYSDGFRYGSEIFSLDPDRGHYYGGNPVHILGDFLVANGIYDLASARSTYSVYFGDNLADYDLSVSPDPLVSANDIYVVAPRASVVPTYFNPYVVTVDIYDRNGLVSFAREPENNQYTYFTEMKIDFVIPPEGPLSGDTQVDIYGSFPVAANMYLNPVFNDNFISIYNTYRVLFDIYDASWDIGRDPLPLIEIDQIYAGYSGVYDVLHMRSPPGFAPGYVDIAAIDLSLTDAAVKLNDGFLYGPGAAIGTWIDCDVTPSPVGKLDAGDLKVTIITSLNAFVDDNGDSNDDVAPFIVPQGGNPRNENHRIPLRAISVASTDGGNIISEWVNTINIDTIMPGFENATDILYMDGHAAVYIREPGDVIIGDDYDPPYTDGSLISDGALLGRHFIIDTIPPVMFISDTQQSTGLGDANYLSAGPSGIDGGLLIYGDYAPFIFEPPNADSSTHPDNVDLPDPTFAQFTHNFPFTVPLTTPPTSGLINVYPDTNPEGTQRFFNVGSHSNFVDNPNLTNDLYDQHLAFEVRVWFKDYDVHTYAQKTIAGEFNPYAPADDDLTTDMDIDPFNNSRIRQVAGFLGTRFVTESNLPLLTRSNPDDNPLDDPLNDPEDADNERLLLARWELQPGSTQLPRDILESTVTYDSTPANISFDTLGGFVYSLKNIEPTDTMEVHWRIEGIPNEEIDEVMRLIIKFSGADRANVYHPRGEIDREPKGNYTDDDLLLDPLQIWWMREVNTEFSYTNVPTSGIVTSPRFEWEITGDRPELGNHVDNPHPLHRYSLWQSARSTDSDENFNGNYQLYAPAGTNASDLWTGWSRVNSLNAGVADGLQPNYWYLLIVNSVDEAGNTERFPEEWEYDSVNDLVGPRRDNNDDVDIDLQGSNWHRFYVEPRESQIETTISPRIWHDNADYGNSQTHDGHVFTDKLIIPLPSVTRYNPQNGIFETIVSAEFTLNSNQETENVLLEYAWSLEREGDILSQGVISQPATQDAIIGAFTHFAFRELGDSDRQIPVNYIFRAAAQTDDGRDLTPAQIRFVVVPNVEEFIRQRKSEPEIFKEFERP